MARVKRGWVPQPPVESEVRRALRGLSESEVAERVAIALGRSIAAATMWRGRTAADPSAIDVALAALRGH